ncbi:Alpha/beta-Hydrolases superfamily protein [Rhynchospora pubera]|uniref:Alpha/beta-Hydrolases superfamily protein n=1 Tax=Rhynchospora pubera TaxID=906938 RepID=A0AAV8DEL6_9POAL|nr:Alpha/beta-Hydrolases superfamily protein [Rhynchospora pubera]
MIKPLLVLFSAVLAAWIYQSIQPPPPKLCGTPNGPPINAPRSKLKDGRYLAYKEWGVPKENAKYKMIYLHGFGSFRFGIPSISQEVLEELGVYLLSYDRPGYGESDPDPNKDAKTVATDTEELADNLNLGPKFYVLGVSMGGAFTWSVVKHMPHRLAGAILLCPAVNFWWPGFPSNVTMQTWNQLLPQEKWAFRVARYFPSLVYWWNTQKLFPRSAIISGDMRIYSLEDKEILPDLIARSAEFMHAAYQQGVYESLHRDIKVWHSEWGFSPVDLPNPFPNNEGSVHLWHGAEDRMAPVLMSRYIAQRLPWIQYHELPTAGHLFSFADGMGDHILKTFFEEH